MKFAKNRELWAGIGLLMGFLVWTALIRRVDVQAAGPRGTTVGFAAWNTRFHRLTGVHMTLYTITDWLGLVPIAVCLGFGSLGAVQLLQRRSVLRVDPDILLLGGYYLLVICAYLLFEMFPINYRPILIDGVLEASYPSSTTLLVLSVMPTLRFQADRRMKRLPLRRLTAGFVDAFSLFMVVGRLISGVHWVTDIIGSTVLSAGLFMVYRSFVRMFDACKEGGYGIQ